MQDKYWGGKREEAGEEVGNSTNGIAAKKIILGCSKTASNTALRAKLGMYSLKTNRDMGKL